MTDQQRRWALFALLAAAILYGGKKVADAIARTEREKKYMPLVDAVSDRLRLDRNILRAIVAQESSWNPAAKNTKTLDYGLAQVNLATAKVLRTRLKRTSDVLPDVLLDPAVNLLYAEALLKEIASRHYDDPEAYFHAWNVGWPSYEKGTRSPYLSGYVTAFDDYVSREEEARA